MGEDYARIEHEDFIYDSQVAHDKRQAQFDGERYPNHEWILSPRDVWYRNPFYTGKPTGRHPEDGLDDEIAQYKLKKSYKFKKGHAEVRTYYETSRCLVVLYDPGLTEKPVERWVDSYSEGAEIAREHTRESILKFS